MAVYFRHVRTFNVLLSSCASTEVRQLSIRCNYHTTRGILRTRHILARRSPSHQLKGSQAICGILPVRLQSSDTTASISTLDKVIPDVPPVPEGYIPDLPPIPDIPVEVVDVLNALGEPTLSSLGLIHYTPPGLVQAALEYMHVSMGMPWWSAIVAGTVVLRLCVFPLVIYAQRNAAQMHNHMPTVQKLQERFTKSRMSGNPMDAARSGEELMNYMKRNKVNPMKNMLVPMAQMPIFVSVFMGIRQMANLPVQSMCAGGILWFTDLTICDPFYALPIITMGTFFVTLELGVDGVRADSMSHVMRNVMRAMPFVMLPFIMNFPTAMLCYWFTSNVFSLSQVLMLKIPGVKDYFNIPRLVVHDKSEMPKKKKFIEGFKETWNNSKVAADMENRQRAEALRFKEAGMGPIQKTFPYDPTKSIAKSKTAISAKPKS